MFVMFFLAFVLGGIIAIIKSCVDDYRNRYRNAYFAAQNNITQLLFQRDYDPEAMEEACRIRDEARDAYDAYIKRTGHF